MSASFDEWVYALNGLDHSSRGPPITKVDTRGEERMPAPWYESHGETKTTHLQHTGERGRRLVKMTRGLRSFASPTAHLPCNDSFGAEIVGIVREDGMCLVTRRSRRRRRIQAKRAALESLNCHVSRNDSVCWIPRYSR